MCERVLRPAEQRGRPAADVDYVTKHLTMYVPCTQVAWCNHCNDFPKIPIREIFYGTREIRVPLTSLVAIMFPHCICIFIMLSVSSGFVFQLLCVDG